MDFSIFPGFKRRISLPSDLAFVFMGPTSGPRTTPDSSKSGCFQVYTIPCNSPIHARQLRSPHKNAFWSLMNIKNNSFSQLISPDQLLSISPNNETRGPFCRMGVAMGVSGCSKGGAHLRSGRKSLGFGSWSWIWSANLRRDLGSCVAEVSTFRQKDSCIYAFLSSMMFWSHHFGLVDVYLLQLGTSWHVFSRDITWIPKAGTNEDRKIESWQGVRMRPDSPKSLNSNEASAGNQWHSCGIQSTKEFIRRSSY